MAVEFHFAWVDDTETEFDPEVHARSDENVFSFKVAHKEGDFATLKVTIPQPSEGLLSPSRKQYAWMSVTKDAVITPFFFGRLNGFPEGFAGDSATLNLLSQFPGWEDSLNALFQTLKVLPYWDPAFISKADLDKPETALEGRSARYHFDRVTGEVTVSDVLVGVSTSSMSNHDRENLDVNEIGAPARRVKVVAEVAWEQRLAGTTGAVNDGIRTKFEGLAVNSLTPTALVTSWPKVGDSFGGSTGYEIVLSSIAETDAVSPFRAPVSVQFHKATTEQERRTTQALYGTPTLSRYATVPRAWFRTRMLTRYDFRQSRSETISATVENDVQPLVYGTDGGTTEISLRAEDVVTLGLMDAGLSSYFLTPRGVTSFKHLLARCKAQLAISSRAIEITAKNDIWAIMALRCTNNLTLEDSRFAGGEVTGKIIGYEFGVDGDSGEANGSVTIGVPVGNGNSYSPAALEPAYCELDYVGFDYQESTGEVGAGLGDTDIIFDAYGSQKPTDPPIINLIRRGDIVQNVTITNQPSVQNAALVANAYPTRDNAAAVLDEVQTKIDVVLRELKPVDDLTHNIVVTIPYPYAAPKGIDLAA